MPDITLLQAGSGGANNGNDATLTFSSASSATGSSNNGALLIVSLGTSRATSLTVTTSSGGSWTQIGTTQISSYCRSGLFRNQIIDSFQAIITGSGGSSDSAIGVSLVFDNIDYASSTPFFQAAATGASSTPDSPTVVLQTTQGAIVSGWGAQLNTTIFTPPSSFSDVITRSVNDTIDACGAMAWITMDSSAFAFNPDPWVTSASASWVSWTVYIEAIQDVYLYQQLRPLEEPQFRISVVGY